MDATIEPIGTLQETLMKETTPMRALKIALVGTGLTFIFLIYPLGLFWPSGWCWGHGPSHYLTMILAVYATLGAFLLVAARDPFAHRSLIWFTVWSSAVHAGVMLYQGVVDPTERGHLVGDVPALLIVAGVLGGLMRWAGRAQDARSTPAWSPTPASQGRR